MKNLRESISYKTEILRLTPQNDITTHPLSKEWVGGDSKREKPVHEVCVDSFLMGKHEMTVGNFRKFADETGYRTEAEKGDGCFVFTGKDWKKESDKNWRNPGFSQEESRSII